MRSQILQLVVGVLATFALASLLAFSDFSPGSNTFMGAVSCSPALVAGDMAVYSGTQWCVPTDTSTSTLLGSLTLGITPSTTRSSAANLTLLDNNQFNITQSQLKMGGNWVITDSHNGTDLGYNFSGFTVFALVGNSSTASDAPLTANSGGNGKATGALSVWSCSFPATGQVLNNYLCDEQPANSATVAPYLDEMTIRDSSTCSTPGAYGIVDTTDAGTILASCLSTSAGLAHCPIAGINTTTGVAPTDDLAINVATAGSGCTTNSLITITVTMRQ